MNIRRPLPALLWTALLAAGLAACGATPAAPGSPATPPTAEAAATAAPALEPTATVASATTPEVPSASPLPTSVATLPPLDTTPLGGAGLNLPPEAVSGAITDLAGRLGIALTDITLVSSEAVEWSDGSLGCPQPGMMYPQVITEGVRVILGAGGKQYAYHGDTQGKLFYCENPTR
jgi:hypothetical protein